MRKLLQILYLDKIFESIKITFFEIFWMNFVIFCFEGQKENYRNTNA
jgi:hypothetical protein